tara:strand:+ start:875 stop:1678 length:804 start_codon:yes stop_codon:yes gene_type:complete
MSHEISQKQIGQRIAELRKVVGLSQLDLSNRVKISRSSLAQIELGNRNVNILELQRFSLELKFSLDHFMSLDFCVSQNLLEESAPAYIKTPERVGEPQLNMTKFINVLLYILEHCAGKPNVSETVLNRLLYFADFNYFELYEEHLTGSKYTKFSFGPLPHQINVIINQLIDSGKLKRIITKDQGDSLVRYLPLIKADLRELMASEKKVIDSVINHMSDWSEKAITSYAHNDMPWLSSKDGEEINYELAFYRQPPYSVRNYDADKCGD